MEKITLSTEQQQQAGIWIDTNIFTGKKIAKQNGEIIGEVQFIEE